MTTKAKQPGDATRPRPAAHEQADEAVLTKVQPSNGAVSEVLTGTPDKPESTRIIPPGESPASAADLRPAEQREESQVAPTQVEGELGLHGNADY